MDDFDLEKLAVKEIIEEIEQNKKKNLQIPLQQQPRPNKRFLGRTIVSVLQHNRRQHAEEKRNSTKKLKELNRMRYGSHKSAEQSQRGDRSGNRKIAQNKTPSQDGYIDNQRSNAFLDEEGTACFYSSPRDLCFLNTVGTPLDSINNIQPKKYKKTKRKSVLTIDLTKEKEHVKKKKGKKKKRKKVKNKKRSPRRDSISSSFSISSVSSTSSPRLSRGRRRRRRSSTLLIDLT